MTNADEVPAAPSAGVPASSQTGPSAALRIVLVYAAFACLWILLSDKVVAWLVSDPETMTLLSTVKGWLFVAVTSLLLFGLIRRLLTSLRHSLETLEQREVALRESAVLLEESQRIAGLGSYVLDIRADAWKGSDMCNQVLGIDASHPHSVQEWAQLVHPDERDAMVDYFRTEVLGLGRTFDREYRIIRPSDQAERWVHGLGQLEFDAQGHPAKLRGTIKDVTERKAAEKKLHLAAGVFNHAREGIAITDATGAILDINEAFTRITGYSREEAVGRNTSMLRAARQDKAFYTAMWRDLLEHGYWSGEIWNRRKSGEVFAELLTISAVRDSQGNTAQYVALFSDITVLKEHQHELEHIAHFDALTNLPNRMVLADRLQQAMNQTQRRNQKVAVAYLDLDDFKTANDRHGHDVGDQLLIALARRMKETLREGDTLARMGGDEFVAVLIDVQDVAICVPMLNRLLSAAAEPVHLGELTLQVSASLGVTLYPQTQELDADQLLRQADQAMYQAKVAGKNRFHVFDAEQDSTIRGHHESLERVRVALERREFVLCYQPKVNMRSGRVIGAEALIRWQHPERGLLPPAVFLPVIEDHSLAIAVGEWVIDTALSACEQWRHAGLDIPVSVNVGALQLQQPDFVDRLQAILAAHPAVNPSRLELEILETSALKDMAQVSQVIEACERIGVRFALDDFGTGYSSLTYLKRLRVTLLKIDQSFVRDMLNDPDDLAILEGVIGLAGAFKRQVIAEGVETIAHGTMLLHLGCELAQGYGIARPMFGHALPAWSAAWQPDPAWAAPPIN